MIAWPIALFTKPPSKPARLPRGRASTLPQPVSFTEINDLLRKIQAANTPAEDQDQTNEHD